MIASLLANWKPAAVALAVVAALYFAWDLSRQFAEGQRAIGAASAVKDEVSHADAVNKARACVRACRADGGMWDNSTGRCINVNNVPLACR